MSSVGTVISKSLLGYHRILSPTAGVRASPICLGTMNFGEAWSIGWVQDNSVQKGTAFEIPDHFFDMGCNFIDTWSKYVPRCGSEEWWGEWMASRKNRDQMVIATKYTTFYLSGKDGEFIKSIFQGNHLKSMYVSLEASLKKLQTSYMDIASSCILMVLFFVFLTITGLKFYVHWWDFSTSIPELMQSLNRMIDAGKVLYLGISDTPAWVVAKANEHARAHGLTQFSIYQGKWSASVRDFERQILPMCEAEGMALGPWRALAQGNFKTAAQRQKQMANKKGTAITTPYVYPIVGGRKLEHLKGNIEVLSIELTDEDIDVIESAYPFDVGLPMSMLSGLNDPSYYKSTMTTKDINLVKSSMTLETPKKVGPIRRYKIEG
ncbi:norsolorinic acid reductase [Lipomyces kononenkoae]|uniref:Norsolorinic acid reductase n=1 Tax=Lipomyces kononenkoae TaxID=34357 RepID=A0ACC3SPY7_LIPKO